MVVVGCDGTGDGGRDGMDLKAKKVKRQLRRTRRALFTKFERVVRQSARVNAKESEQHSFKTCQYRRYLGGVGKFITMTSTYY